MTPSLVRLAYQRKKPYVNSIIDRRSVDSRKEPPKIIICKQVQKHRTFCLLNNRPEIALVSFSKVYYSLKGGTKNENGFCLQVPSLFGKQN